MEDFQKPLCAKLCICVLHFCCIIVGCTHQNSSFIGVGESYEEKKNPSSMLASIHMKQEHDLEYCRTITYEPVMYFIIILAGCIDLS